MNGQIRFESFENPDPQEALKRLKGLEKYIRVYEEGLEELSRAEAGEAKELLRLTNFQLRETIIEAFDDFVDEYCDNEALDEIVSAFKAAVMQSVADGACGVRAFYNAMIQYVAGGYDAISNMPIADKLEILAGLNESNETGIAYCEDNPLIKALLKREGTETTKLTVFNANDLTIKQGAMQMYQKELFDNIMKAKREGKVTSSGWIYFTTGQLNKWISGGAKLSPSKEQTSYNVEMITEMGNTRISYMTDKSLADLLGLDVGEEIPGFKFTGGVNAQFYEVRFYSGTEFRGQICKDSLLVMVKLNEEVEKLLDGLNWYEPMPEEIKRIQCVGKTGELKNWPLTKERITLRTCLINFVVSYTRARTPTPNSPAKPYSNRMPYKKIFEACGIETDHSTKRRRKIDDIAVIMDHLQREGMLSAWREYTNRGSKKADGIEIFIAKEMLEGGVN